MKIAIDLDGTAFKWPREFQNLVACLVQGGAEVVFLTAAAGEFPPEDRPAEVARRVSFRLPHCVGVRIVCCESWEKGDWLRDNGFDLLIDDNLAAGWKGLQLVPAG
jgi:hypothetical protein